ncbi:Zinc-type alcohol dehydrogenase-like protein [Crateriforma conspicua]|uniref:Zinc-type alcohol dehydrogenase-like protein n=1 Tax=Crateriforma conspicua TaxID=2527996 RepID=A0A5C5Y945_9PLAN|nr:NAD(P)-dependent alcohol dehydrogenase [Crateriforma conspicua]TWT71343.1 Zinc-type alcohol dehydrogenase-like protein [Crateriforma conspicua]TWU64724.1 Zinc-type alcohol dehydrogenase-like protein [Crateriforma conspicua]
MTTIDMPNAQSIPLRPAGSTMSAVTYEDYGDASVLKSSTVDVPHRRPGQLLLQVVASSVNPIDYRMRQGEMRAVLPGGFPRIPGYDVAGYVADNGGDGPFQVGDRVIAFLKHLTGGASADYATCAVHCVAKIPDDLPFDEAAAMPLAGTTALQSLRDHAKMQAGNRVLVNGASGGVGMFAVQIAKASGCHVDAVASADNEAYCRSLGADGFIDYTQADFTKIGQTWDIIFDAAGKSSYFEARAVLASGGHYVSTEPNLSGLAVSLLTWPLSKSGRIMLAKPNGEDLLQLIDLYRQSKLKITIDRHYGLSQLADAHRRVEQGVDRGKVVVMNDSM